METIDDGTQDDRLSNAGVDNATLKKRAIRGVAVNFGSQFLKFVIQFVYQIFIIRLLLPADFGLVAMASPVLAFVQLFTDVGLSQAVVQRAHISQLQLSSLFWLNVLVSAGVSLLTMAAAPLVGMFYNDPRAAQIVVALGAMLFLSGLQAIQWALLNRRMAFTQLSIVNLVSAVLGCVAGIGSAMAGLGYWSLVVNQFAMSISSLLMVWVFSGWTPNAPRNLRGIRDLLGFGGNVMGFNVVNFFARNLDNILVGKVWGQTGLGDYDRAYKLLLLPLNQIVLPFASVVLPMLSRTLKEPAVYRRGYFRVLETLLLLTYPGILFALCTSHQLIVTVLGQRWAGIAPIFSILAVGGLFAPISSSTGWLFISQDRTREMRNWGIISSAMFVTSFIVGLPWGPVGVAACYIGVGLVQGPMLWWAVTRSGPVTLRVLLTTLFPFVPSSAATIATTLGLKTILPATAMSLAVLLIVAHVVFVGCLALMPPGRLLLADLYAQARALMSRRRDGVKA